MCLEFNFTNAVQISLESVHKLKIMSSKEVGHLKAFYPFITIKDFYLMTY